MSRKEEGGGGSRGIMQIESIVLRAAGCFSNFDLCSKVNIILWLCCARGDAISPRAKEFPLRLCSGGQVNCWSERLGGLLLDWTPGVIVIGDANTLLRCVSVPVLEYIAKSTRTSRLNAAAGEVRMRMRLRVQSKVEE